MCDNEDTDLQYVKMGKSNHLVFCGLQSEKNKLSIFQGMETVWDFLFTYYLLPDVIQKVIPLPLLH